MQRAVAIACGTHPGGSGKRSSSWPSQDHRLLGPFIGAVVGELTRQRGARDAARAGATIGLALGAAAKLALAFSMLGIFALARSS